MAEIKLTTWPVGADKKNSTEIWIVFKLTHQNQRRIINTNIKLEKTHFDGSQVILSTHRKNHNIAIDKLRLRYSTKLSEISNRDDSMNIDEVKEYLIDDSVERKELVNVFTELKDYEDELRAKKEGSANNFYYTRKFLAEWWGSEVLSFETLNYIKLREFHRWLCSQKWTKVKRVNKKLITTKHPYAQNTIHMRFRNLRAVFNRAITLERMPLMPDPFRQLMKKDVKQNLETGHRDLTITQFQALRDLDLASETRRIQEAQDFFLLSFYLVGINLCDLWEYDFSRLDRGIIEYGRRKTNKGAKFTIPTVAIPILSRYIDSKGVFKLTKRIKLYESFKSGVNKGLKPIGREIGVPNLTYYWARHTWSSLATNQGKLSDSDIELALTHGSHTVTDGYMNKDRERLSRVDAAHKIILELVA